jgi:hypothetical protein
MTKKMDNAIKTREITKKQISIMLPISTLEEIGKIVAKIPNMTKNQFMSNLLMMGLDDVKLLDSVGLITGIEYVRKIMEDTVELFRRNLSEQTKDSFKK